MLNPFGNTVNEYYVRKFKDNAINRQKHLETLRTREDFLAYQKEIRIKIKNAFRLPAQKTPLSPIIADVITCNGFKIEKVIYHSRPQLPVTANLYVPDKAVNAPSVLFLCGHAAEGKACETYLKAILNLVANGYVVLCPDPSGQGERGLFVDDQEVAEIAGIPTREHNMIAKQMLMVGEYYSSWCLWDAVRSLDYLLSRPEVSPDHVTVTGNSGGGNMSAFLTAIDERLFAAAPSCYITSWRRNIENEEPCDAEQEPPELIGAGCEMGDLLLAYAPRPLLILGQKNDFFDPRGTQETYEEVKFFYDMLGASDKVELFIGPCDHGYHGENRNALYQFLNFQLGHETLNSESDIGDLPTGEELQCTPHGQVALLPRERRTIDLIRDLANELKWKRPVLNAEELKLHFTRQFKLENYAVPYYRCLRTRHFKGIHFARFGLEIESGMLAILKYINQEHDFFHFPENIENAILYIPHVDSCDEITKMKFDSTWEVFGLDMRGIGEMMPLSCDMTGYHAIMYDSQYIRDRQYSAQDQIGREFFADYCDDYHFSACGLMLDEPYLGGRVRDILGTLMLMKSKGYKKIKLVARGQGTIPASLAALIFGDIDEVALIDAPASFDTLINQKIIHLPQTCIPVGILRFTDMPEIYQHINAMLLS